MQGLPKVTKSKTIDEPRFSTNSVCAMVFICRAKSDFVGRTEFHFSPRRSHFGAIGTIISLFFSSTPSKRFEKSTGQRRKTIPSFCPFLFSFLTAFAVSERYCGSFGEVV